MTNKKGVSKTAEAISETPKPEYQKSLELSIREFEKRLQSYEKLADMTLNLMKVTSDYSAYEEWLGLERTIAKSYDLLAVARYGY